MTMTKCNDTQPVRLPAEWERTGAVMIAWPHAATDWAYMLDEVDRCYTDLCTAISRFANVLIVTPEPQRIVPLLIASDADPERLRWFKTPTNDTWTRDYGPLITTSGPDDWYINDFVFNGWGMKFAADKDNCVTRNMFADNAIQGHYSNRLDFVLEGGSVESDGKGTLMTTSQCLLSPNRNAALSRDDIERRLCDTLGVHRVLWVDHGALAGDDTDSHIDTLARFAPDDTIVYVACQPDDEHYDELCRMRTDLEQLRTDDGRPYRLLPLPLPDPIFDADGQRLPATYANFLALNNAVLMPTYGQPDNDSAAAAILATAFPGCEIVTVDCRPLIFQHGSLHCATMQLPYEILPLCPTPCE